MNGATVARVLEADDDGTVRVGERGWVRLVAAGFGLLLALAGLALVVIAPGASGGLAIFAGLSWAALMLAAFWATVGFEIGDRELVVRRGWERLELAWADVEGLEVIVTGELRFRLAAAARQRLRVPGELRVRAPIGVSAMELEALATERWTAARAGGEAPEQPVRRRARAPGANGSRSLVVTAPDGAVRLMVMLANPDIGQAAVELAMLTADEHRWNPAWTGELRFQLSRQQTAPSPAISARMEEVVRETRAELARRGWTAPGGTPISIAWSFLGDPGAGAAAADGP